MIYFYTRLADGSEYAFSPQELTPGDKSKSADLEAELAKPVRDKEALETKGASLVATQVLRRDTLPDMSEKLHPMATAVYAASWDGRTDFVTTILKGGYDPFELEAKHRVRAKIAALSQGLEGNVEWLNADKQSEGERRLSSPNPDCQAFARGLSFAIAVQTKPDILLVDEVFSVGDENFQRKSAMRMRKLIDEGVIVVLVTHNTGLIRQLCNRAIWLDRGALMEDNKPNEVCESYMRHITR